MPKIAYSCLLVPKGNFRFIWGNLAGPTRLELATSGVTGRRSNQLNYDPARGLAYYREMLPDFQGRLGPLSGQEWVSQPGSSAISGWNVVWRMPNLEETISSALRMTGWISWPLEIFR